MIIIDYKDRRPIYEQIVERFQDLILRGVLQPDSQLPSVRNLSMELSINPNTIQKAYTELERRGFTYSVKGRGSFIAANGNLIECKKEELLEELLTLVKKGKELGIKREQFMSKLDEGYKEVIKDD
ncbi:GntR family transcriptional regulator [Anaerocolumna sp. MB42-C2]|uniref:GntR family transcriptional regulator n=1 Tax=Anaerocolumna sp. MB42-C2 TaxID=3070997 RepID=UPI0027DF1741|nr:GntR family transcriptional regulator [Anaerocolumna sp. MB42-C2]WMJ88236.1 GntR family transcriptional regulator [Anaerocolumna sp. MB42-C2]